MSDPSELADPRRVEAVRESGLLDSPREREFDQLTRLAARLLDAPSAFVTVISEDRQFIKSAASDEAPDLTGVSQPLEMSFCKYSVASNAPLIVEDSRKHELVRHSKAVAAGVIAYAGVPLRTRSGEAIGALCVVDSKPRRWSEDEIESLRLLARSAMQIIDGRLAAGRKAGRQAVHEKVEQLLDCVTIHLKALDAYSSLVRGSRQVDLNREAQLRDEVLQSFRSMRDLFERSTREFENRDEDDKELLDVVARYVAASDERERAASGFAEGSLELATLELSIGDQLNAADSLRLAALHRGAEL